MLPTMLPTMLPVLVRASLEGALLAALVWLVVRTVPRLSPSIRTVLWWCVAAKFVVALVWRAPIAVPVLPAVTVPVVSTPTTNMTDNMTDARTAQQRAAPPALGSGVNGREATPARTSPLDIPWTAIVLAMWSAGLLVSLVRTLRSWQETNGVVARSTPGSEALHVTVRELSRLLGVRRAADVRLSTEIESPLITGVRAPVILVPAGRFPLLTDEQQRMALCHELAHMKRGDLWLGCVPAAVERCFFFHPLARLAAREYAFWREAACDEAVLTTLRTSPQSYGRLLLALGVSRQPATFAAAGAAWSFSNLKRRITMLGHPSSPSRGGRALAAVAVALAVVAVAPVKAVARSASPGERVLVGVPASEVTSLDPSPTPVAEASPGSTPAARTDSPSPIASSATTSSPHAVADSPPHASPAIAADSASAVVTTSVVPSVAAPADSLASVPVAQDGNAQDRRQDDVRFVYFNGDKSTTISGSSNDASRARRYQRSGEPMLWFRRDGREYIVRDSRVLRDVEDLWEPVSRIGEEQGRIGAKQGEIGAEQGRHGAKQGEIGAAQGVIGAKQGVVAARLGLLAARESQGLSGSERRDIEREREELRRDMRELDREMDALNRKMRDYNPPMRELGDEMSALGREMSSLGARMNDATRRANSGMRSLIDRAIRSGAAEEIR